MAVIGYGLTLAGAAAHGRLSALPFGPRPAQFIGLMLAIGLLASWLGTLCWNEASQRLPTTLVGPADRLRDAFGPGLCLRAARRMAPAGDAGRGGALIAGVMGALRIKPIHAGA